MEANKTKYSMQAVAALAEAFGKSFITIQRWIQDNDDRLTSERAKEVMAQFKPVKIKK